MDPNRRTTLSGEWRPSQIAVRKPVGSPSASSAKTLSPPQESPGYFESDFPSPEFVFSGRGSPAYFSPTDAQFVGARQGVPLDSWRPSPQMQDRQFLGAHGKHESQTALLGNLPAENTFNIQPGYGYPPNDGGYPPPRPNIADWYAKNWNQAWNMYFFFISGVLFAAGHHIFYRSLHGKEANDQLRMLRYGTALAFLAKACFAATVIFAFRQRAWMTVRHKILPLEAVDSLFAAADDLTALLNWQVLRNAKTAICLAVYIWATPLVVILTSETLAVTPLTRREDTMCPSIRTLNFTHEETKDYRDPITVADLFELSVSLWNTTATTPRVDTKNPNSFDYWTDTSQQYIEVAWKSAFLQQALMRKHAAKEICGVGWNCSYVIQFVGPGYNCTELASGVNGTVKKLGDAEPPFDTSVLLPYGNYSYIAMADQGEYAAQQVDSGDGGRPKQGPPYPEKLGVFRTEPIVWIGYAAVENNTKHQPENNTVDGWYEAYTPTIFACEHYETNYTFRVNYTNGLQTHTVLDRLFMDKVIDTRYIPDELDLQDGTWDNTTAVPESNYIYPRDLHKYRKTGAYHSMGKQMRAFMNGTIVMPGYVSKTLALQTRLIDRHNYLPVANIQKEVQNFYEEMILSLLSDPQFIAVSWAHDPSQYTGITVGGEETNFACTRERTTNCYFYHEAQLWVVYVAAILIAICGLVSGVLATRGEGVVRNTRFSSFAAATRGQGGLEQVQWNDDPNVGNLRVGYGLVPGLAGERIYGYQGNMVTSYDGVVMERQGGQICKSYY
ncbi:Fc.00g010230.m01.CDS01 [Cosmosporella sp. VM-42]